MKAFWVSAFTLLIAAAAPATAPAEASSGAGPAGFAPLAESEGGEPVAPAAEGEGAAYLAQAPEPGDEASETAEPPRGEAETEGDETGPAEVEGEAAQAEQTAQAEEAVGADSEAEAAEAADAPAEAGAEAAEAGEAAAETDAEDPDAEEADAEEADAEEADAEEAEAEDPDAEEADTADGEDEAEDESVADRDFGDVVISEGGTFWMPPQASTVAGEVDWLFYAITALSIFCFVGITIVLVYFCVRYRAQRAPKPEPSATHNDVVEITWTVIPSIIVVIIFVIGWRGYMEMKAMPEHAEEIRVTAEKWNWEFTYPNGWTEDRLHVPVDRPVRLIMTSRDVLHSLFIPAFRTKMDVVPNRYTRKWFEAEEPGVYRLYCAEYCGDRHAHMDAEVVVHPRGQYESYLEEAQQEMLDLPPVELGEFVFEQRGCEQCHDVEDGVDGEGPTLVGIWGEEHELDDGSTVTVDDNHIRKALLEPQERVRAGFDPIMPTFQGRLDDREIEGLIEYIKSLDE